MTAGIGAGPLLPIPPSDLALILYRLTAIEQKVDLLLADHEARLRAVEEDMARMVERQTNWNMGLAAFTAVAAAVAAFFGRRIP